MQTLLHGINKSINKEEEMYVNRKGELKLPSLNNTDTIIEAEVQSLHAALHTNITLSVQRQDPTGTN